LEALETLLTILSTAEREHLLTHLVAKEAPRRQDPAAARPSHVSASSAPQPFFVETERQRLLEAVFAPLRRSLRGERPTIPAGWQHAERPFTLAITPTAAGKDARVFLRPESAGGDLIVVPDSERAFELVTSGVHLLMRNRGNRSAEETRNGLAIE